MSAPWRFARRFLHVAWAIPAILFVLSIIPLLLGLGLAMWFFTLVGQLVGMEHFEVGIGAAPSDAVGWTASLILYLILCASIAGVWYLLAERRSS